MIYLCQKREEVLSAINNIRSNTYILHHIRLYLDSYGAKYDFVQFFLQKDSENDLTTAVILRYNNQVFSAVSKFSDLPELASFLQGFSDCTITADNVLSEYFNNFQTGYIMCRFGAASSVNTNSLILLNNAREIADLVADNLTASNKEDFFLNTSHQIRHNTINVYGVYAKNKLVSVASASVQTNNISVITFVYTHEHFRGNGYSNRILSHICSEADIKYMLICEKHNVEFYHKCGFSQDDTCIIINL